MSKQHLRRPTYRPDIDGLRAIAVLAVVFHHAFPTIIEGGFIGVDVFFVISGFLISTIIFNNLDSGRFTFAEFYARRIKRIFPALLLVLCATYLFGWYVLFIDEFSQLGKHVAAGASFISNFVFWSEAGYFDTSAAAKPLLHLWSLGVEEQFYIVWPIILVLFWHSHTSFLLTTVLVAVVSFMLSVYMVVKHPVAGFYSPFSRMWELMVGGMLGYIMLYKPDYLPGHEKVSSAIALLGIVLVGAGVFLLDKSSLFPGWLALLPVVGAFLVILASPDNWVNSYLLGNRFLVGVGLISYPIYLWHWPLLSYANILNADTRGVRITLVMVSILLAWLTYYFVERKFKRSYTGYSIITMSLVMAVFLVVGLAAWQKHIVPRHSSEPLMRVFEAIDDWDYPGELEQYTAGNLTLYIMKGSKNKTMFLGDSHMEQYGPRVTHLLEGNSELNTAIFATGGGCVPIPGVGEDHRIHDLCENLVSDALLYVEDNNIGTIVIGAAWNNYFIEAPPEAGLSGDVGYEYYTLDEFGNREYFNGGRGIELALAGLARLVAELIKNGKKVFLIVDNPASSTFSPKQYISGTRMSEVTYKNRIGENAPYPVGQEELRARFYDIAESTGAVIIDPILQLCDSHGCRITYEDGKPIYKDANHLRASFVKENARYLDVTMQ